MKHSFWPDGSYPIFIDPDFNELMELAKSGWDTVRICLNQNDDFIAMASGHGNTHQSVIDAVKNVKGLRRWHPETYILFKEQGDFWFNLEDVSGERKAHYRKVVKEYFSDVHGQMILDLIANSE